MPRILFYPRPPRGGRPARLYSSATLGRFLPTPSARRATDLNKAELADLLISTHALREEGDQGGSPAKSSQAKFLPTPSARRATYDYGNNTMQFLFLPTPSVRRATVSSRKSPIKGIISTHALREEGDASSRRPGARWPDFYPRPP